MTDRIWLRVVATSHGIRRIEFLPPRRQGAKREASDPADASAAAREHVVAALRQLAAYFEGRLRQFELSLDLEGTQHQLRIWESLRAIPYGETRTYGALARETGSPGGSRAVGRACATNPIPVAIPCHRVVGSAGELRGFGGGIPVKRELLDLEHGQGILR